MPVRHSNPILRLKSDDPRTVWFRHIDAQGRVRDSLIKTGETHKFPGDLLRGNTEEQAEDTLTGCLENIPDIPEKIRKIA